MAEKTLGAGDVNENLSSSHGKYVNVRRDLFVFACFSKKHQNFHFKAVETVAASLDVEWKSEKNFFN
jgi:hypothetical protein